MTLNKTKNKRQPGACHPGSEQSRFPGSKPKTADVWKRNNKRGVRTVVVLPGCLITACAFYSRGT